MQVGTLVKINPSSTSWRSDDEAVLEVIPNINPYVHLQGWITTKVVSGTVCSTEEGSGDLLFTEGWHVVGASDEDFVELTDAEREEI